MSPTFLVYTNERQSGPYSLEQLRNMRRTGVITSGTYILPDGATEWVHLSTIEHWLDVPPPQPVAAAENTIYGVCLVLFLLMIGFVIYIKLAPKSKDDYEQNAYSLSKNIIKSSLVDRSYFEPDSWSVIENKHPYYIIRVTWRQRNAFGGIIMQSGVCCLKLTNDGNEAEYNKDVGVQLIENGQRMTRQEVELLKSINGWQE